MVEEGVQLTKRKIFENLLFNVFAMMSEKGEVEISSSSNKIPQRVSKIVSSIIKEYFNEEEHFGKNITTTSFSEYWYCIETTKELSLFHTS